MITMMQRRKENLFASRKEGIGDALELITRKVEFGVFFVEILLEIDAKGRNLCCFDHNDEIRCMREGKERKERKVKPCFMALRVSYCSSGSPRPFLSNTRIVCSTTFRFDVVDDNDQSSDPTNE